MSYRQLHRLDLEKIRLAQGIHENRMCRMTNVNRNSTPLTFIECSKRLFRGLPNGATKRTRLVFSVLVFFLQFFGVIWEDLTWGFVVVYCHSEPSLHAVASPRPTYLLVIEALSFSKTS